MKRLIVGISGASGAIYGVRLLQVLRDVTDIETHLVMSQAARQTLSLETDFSLREVQALADVTHDARDIAASISSGSFQTLGMVILPCSIKTLSGIVHSYTDGLLTRAADVVLKERRPLVLCVRETPLHLGHLRLMTQAPDLIPRNGFFSARSAGISRCHARCARYCRQHLFRFFPDAGDGDFTLFNQNPFRHCP